MSSFDDPKYGCQRNGKGPFNVIEVNKYNLNEVNCTYILMPDICCHHETICIWTMV